MNVAFNRLVADKVDCLPLISVLIVSMVVPAMVFAVKVPQIVVSLFTMRLPAVPRMVTVPEMLVSPEIVTVPEMFSAEPVMLPLATIFPDVPEMSLEMVNWLAVRFPATERAVSNTWVVEVEVVGLRNTIPETFMLVCTTSMVASPLAAVNAIRVLPLDGAVSLSRSIRNCLFSTAGAWNLNPFPSEVVKKNPFGTFVAEMDKSGPWIFCTK